MFVVSLPFLGFVFAIFARFIGKRSACALTIGAVALAFIYSLLLLKKVYVDEITYIYQIDWINFQNFNVEFSFLFDPLSAIMTVLVTFITLLVMIYSYGYLNEDPSLVRFLAYSTLR